MPLEIIPRETKGFRDTSHKKNKGLQEFWQDKSHIRLIGITRIFDLNYLESIRRIRYFKKLGNPKLIFSQKGNELYFQIINLFPLFEFLAEQKLLHFPPSEQDGEINYQNKDGVRIRLYREKQ